jgi:glycerophosphoryl diester phosphodiesterase
MAAPAWLTARPVAHRGFHDRAAGRIENTIPAAEAAIARGFAIECDLQLTRDGVPVVFHDDALDRLAEATGPVAARTLDELRDIPLRGTTARIPTLTELLAAIDRRVPLIAEFKSRFDRDRRLEAAAASRLAAYGGPLAVMSFDPESVRVLGEFLPDLPRGLIADSYTDPEWDFIPPLRRLALRHLAAVPAIVPDFLAYAVYDLPAEAPLALHAVGMPLLVWTVRTAADRATAARYADQIIFEDFDPAVTDTASARSAGTR